MEGGRGCEEGAPGHRAVYALPVTAPDLGVRGGNHVGTPLRAWVDALLWDIRFRRPERYHF